MGGSDVVSLVAVLWYKLYYFTIIPRARVGYEVIDSQRKDLADFALQEQPVDYGRYCWGMV